MLEGVFSFTFLLLFMTKNMTNTESNSLYSDEFLLQCVSNYRPLYDKSDKGYKSILQKENCWTSVAKSLSCSVSEAKTRFKSLREKYRREVQILEKLERSGAPASTRPVWPLMSFFKFMYKCGDESQRQTTSNISLQETESQASEQFHNIFNLSDSDDENIILQFGQENNPTASGSVVTNAPKSKKRKGKSVTETSNVTTDLKQIDNVLVDVSTAINKLTSNKKETIDNRYELFSQYLTSELKNLGEPHASIVMEELQVTLINYKREIRGDK